MLINTHWIVKILSCLYCRCICQHFKIVIVIRCRAWRIPSLSCGVAPFWIMLFKITELSYRSFRCASCMLRNAYTFYVKYVCMTQAECWCCLVMYFLNNKSVYTLCTFYIILSGRGLQWYINQILYVNQTIFNTFLSRYR